MKRINEGKTKEDHLNDLLKYLIETSKNYHLEEKTARREGDQQVGEKYNAYQHGLQIAIDALEKLIHQ